MFPVYGFTSMDYQVKPKTQKNQSVMPQNNDTTMRKDTTKMSKTPMKKKVQSSTKLQSPTKMNKDTTKMY